jgi:membrane-associated protein
MSLLAIFIDFIMHLDTHLSLIIDKFGVWSYFILFFMIFLETGFVFTPFLPGDSLLFAAGALASIGAFNILVLIIILAAAAVLGDSVNYGIGHFIGEKIFSWKITFIKKHHLDRTHAFYEKHGGKTIIIARFIPIVRTFAPFLAGIGKMRYLKFLSYNIIGGILWVMAFLGAGYFFGNIPFVKHNFSLTVLGIIIISLIPTVFEFISQSRYNKKGKGKDQDKPKEKSK